MTGWKTWAAGIGMILTGAGMVAAALSGNADISMAAGIETMLLGLAALGIGHKIDKAASS